MVLKKESLVRQQLKWYLHTDISSFHVPIVLNGTEPNQELDKEITLPEVKQLS